MTRSAHIGRVLSALLLAVGLVAVAESLAWRGARFPGFFVMPNRVVPSVGLPGWSGVGEGRPLYQQVVLAVDGAKAGDAADVYRAVALHRAGTDVEYMVAREGAVESRLLPPRTFGAGEYVAIFGMYLVCGIFYLALAVLAVERRAAAPALHGGLAALAWVGAAFALTAMDLYGPGRLFRLHAAAEALLPAAFVHLALVCPGDRVRGRPGLLPLVYGVGIALAAVYQVLLYEPRAYTVVHDVCQALIVPPAFAVAIMLALALSDPPSTLGARGTRRLLGGTLVGIVAPAIVLGISGASGGRVPVNASAWVSFVFPLAAILSLRAPARS